jgi:hypothetical protein
MGRFSKYVETRMRTVRSHQKDTTHVCQCEDCSWYRAQCEAASKRPYTGPLPPRNSMQSILKKAARDARKEVKNYPLGQSPAAVAFRAALDRNKPK